MTEKKDNPKTADKSPARPSRSMVSFAANVGVSTGDIHIPAGESGKLPRKSAEELQRRGKGRIV
jgi:hypothetical protein